MSNTYTIITPAFNEGKHIENTIKSVLSQSILPQEWVIVNDGSTDDTAEIILKYSKIHNWITYIHRQKDKSQSYYSSNVYAIMEGYNGITGRHNDFLCILDSDIILCPNYYELIFSKFRKYPELGIATGVYTEKINGKVIQPDIDRMSTPKAIQVFRWECFIEIGGYVPLRNGGEDSYAEVSARERGWQTWSFQDIVVEHLRPVGTGDGRSILKARFRLGKTDYGIGTQPAFMVLKCLRRCFKETPYILSGAVRLLGYYTCYLKKEKRSISKITMNYLRKEQIHRLKTIVGFTKKQWKAE